MPGVEPEQILRDTDLIVRISGRAEHILLTGGGGKNRAQHLLDAGFSDTAGHRRKPERGKPHAVHPRERLIGAQRIFRKQHRNRTIRGNFLPFPLRNAEGAATGRDCRIEKVVRIELLPRKRQEEPALPACRVSVNTPGKKSSRDPPSSDRPSPRRPPSPKIRRKSYHSLILRTLRTVSPRKITRAVSEGVSQYIQVSLRKSGVRTAGGGP